MYHAMIAATGYTVGYVGSTIIVCVAVALGVGWIVQKRKPNGGSIFRTWWVLLLALVLAIAFLVIRHP